MPKVNHHYHVEVHYPDGGKSQVTTRTKRQAQDIVRLRTAITRGQPWYGELHIYGPFGPECHNPYES